MEKSVTFSNYKSYKMGFLTENDEQHVSKKYKTFQEFLDNEQYSLKGILSYEKIFGRAFVSVGGLQSTKAVCSNLEFPKGCKVLDVGCGIGGSAFYMRKEFNAEVFGIDLSDNMIQIAKERIEEAQIDNVKFELADVMKIDIAPESYDIIYSRDTILHIKDKDTLFKNFLKWLKPGGSIIITDYCCSDGQWTEEFSDYVKGRGYYLLSLQDYAEKIKSSGFVNVRPINYTGLFLECLKNEIKLLDELQKKNVEEEWSEELYQYRRNGWQAKVKRAETGQQLWGLFIATKPHLANGPKE